VVTLVERASRYLMLIALPDGYKAEQVRPALAAAVARLPEQVRRSLTWDQGKEMAEHTKFTVDTGVQVSFCDPRSPWQRGSNGLLRQYLSRGADLRQLDQASLDAIAAELNGRPRQTLGFKTPSQALAEALPRPPETAYVSGQLPQSTWVKRSGRTTIVVGIRDAVRGARGPAVPGAGRREPGQTALFTGPEVKAAWRPRAWRLASGVIDTGSGASYRPSDGAPWG
jgi:hypothetical protein